MRPTRNTHNNTLLGDLKNRFPGNYQLKKHGKSFNFAQYFIPKSEAKAIQSLYEICRLIDNIADCTASSREQRLHKLTMIEQTITKHNHASQITIDGEHTIKTKSLHVLLQGARHDVTVNQLESMNDLIEYCYQVAGTVGLMMCDLMQIHSRQARLHAVDLGIAMQLTNIARDVWQDRLLGRVYLPKTLVGTCNIEQINNPSDALSQQINTAIEQLLQQAQQFYCSGFIGLRYIPKKYRYAIYVAAKLYQAISPEITKSERYCKPEKAFVSLPKKCLIATQCYVRYISATCNPESCLQPQDHALFRNLAFFESCI